MTRLLPRNRAGICMETTGGASSKRWNPRCRIGYLYEHWFYPRLHSLAFYVRVRPNTSSNYWAVPRENPPHITPQSEKQPRDRRYGSSGCIFLGCMKIKKSWRKSGTRIKLDTRTRAPLPPIAAAASAKSLLRLPRTRDRLSSSEARAKWPGMHEKERQGSMLNEKRALDASDRDDSPPEPKRPKVPALASVIVEALKVDSLQKICSSLEPILRRVVSEEIERALSNLGPARISGGRVSPKRIEEPDGRNLHLRFRTMLSLPLFTGGKVEGEHGASILVVLIDANSGQVVSSGPEASAKLDVLVLEGDFNTEDDENWTEEDFESHIVKEREGKRPLLTGELQVSLKDGIGTLGEITFTDNSSWIRSRKFRLGLKIAAGYCEGIRIREAKTEAFMVKDHRGELYKKHYPPALKDEVWRLEKIGKDGSFHKKLYQHGIKTVEDFLKSFVRDPQRLRNILGGGMSNKMWDSLVEHAKTCALRDKYYVYYPDETRNTGAIFNDIYEFCGLIAGGQFCSAESLSDSQKDFADALVKKAYNNWKYVIEYDDSALLNYKKNKKAADLEKESLLAPSNYPTYDQHTSQMHSQSSVPLHQHSLEMLNAAEGGAISAGYDGNQAIGYSNLPQNADSKAHMPTESPSYVPQNNLSASTYQAGLSRNDSTQLGLTPMWQPSMKFQSFDQSVEHPEPAAYDDWSCHDTRNTNDFFLEEEIRLRSHEILENEDMQQLLRVSLYDDGYDFSSYIPSPFPAFNFDDHRSSTSGKAVVGWLKIKAAMRWGIFVRKKAAERRAAQLVELED
ncbi:calmodulin-binding protein 60 D [Canna indica]|uniref:Calmodulin-binding protein 60 D n=1 Tax=Canna indica TaxID=4628 RepID=A0AAQ3Q4I6_9LILI|nr:calmodulin-binding protein 60 D [Canna indica]